MARKARLDAELVRRGLARSREHAGSLISDGMVTVQGMPASKPATGVVPDVSIVVRDQDPGWASRGAYKLLGALREFEPAGLSVVGRRCLDAGASTGGFTDVLLSWGAAEVVAADVGRGLLDWRLRTDDRVTVLERTNVRSLGPADIGGAVDLVVADLSFISLGLVLPAFVACTAAGANLLLMVKPQFEVGKERLGSGGVVRDQRLREEALLSVLTTGEELGLCAAGAVASPLPGPSGNVEYFAWFRVRAGVHRDDDRSVELAEIARVAVAEGPR